VPGLDGRTFAVLGLFWPSKKFADSELIPSGAASVGSVVTEATLKQQIEGLKGVFSAKDADANLTKAAQLVGRLDDSPAARKEFADLVRSVLPRGAANDEDASDRFFGVDGEQLMRRLSQPIFAAPPSRPSGTGNASSVSSGGGSAAGFELSLSGMKAAARRLLNYGTYYQMKERAGTVGRAGVNDVLRTVKQSHPNVRIHLIGHSFGGRLVTAAAAGPDDKSPVGISTMTLLQAAYSHNGMAQKYDGTHDGVFRRIVADQIISGPTMITCTPNDIAVGQAYPIASRIANQAASALGDKNDLYGGIGRNGAQHTPEAVEAELLAVPSAYQLEARKIYNLHADAFISDHGDVTGPEVAQAILSAVSVS
jgi:pimeloyl-ACP methyl ester carboxylesterase